MIYNKEIRYGPSEQLQLQDFLYVCRAAQCEDLKNFTFERLRKLFNHS